ncbi:MAG: plastocyanin/azurin family copper-binding protein [bacterium]
MRVGILIPGLLFAVACGGSDKSPTPPVSTNKTVDVFTLSTVFSPNFVQIARGDTIRFTIVPSSNGEGHDVTFDAKSGAPENIKVTLNGVVTRVFNTSGTFHYNCFVHPGMTGDIAVQ